MPMDNTLRLQYLLALGIDVWLPKASRIKPIAAPSSNATIAADGTASFAADLDSPYALLDWEMLAKIPVNDSYCVLEDSNVRPPSSSQAHTQWLWLVETADDGGQDGEQLLTDLLLSIGLARGQVAMTRVLAGFNRTEEAQANCRRFLNRQIALLHPAIILILGIETAKMLLPAMTGLGVTHLFAAQAEEASTIPVVATYSLIHLLRSSQDKPRVWQDLQLAMKMLTVAQ